METTRKTVADKFGAYLHQDIPIAMLVEWAEVAILDGEF
jgi:hypothetical protein